MLSDELNVFDRSEHFRIIHSWRKVSKSWHPGLPESLGAEPHCRIRVRCSLSEADEEALGGRCHETADESVMIVADCLRFFSFLFFFPEKCVSCQERVLACTLLVINFTDNCRCPRGWGNGRQPYDMDDGARVDSSI